MPLYEYECTACGERTEIIQRLSDPPLADCPKCGQPVKKLLSAPSFQFKGSGWYVTDYASKSSGASGTSDSTGSGTGSETAGSSPGAASSDKPKKKEAKAGD